jgi:hypothetical protein
METLSYDARDVVITWGEIELEGPAPGTFVTIVYDADAVTKTRGAQNFVVAIVTGNDGGSVTWTASQASPTNDRLSAIAALQRQKGVGLVKKPLQVKHVNGTTLAIGPEAWIKKVPDSAFGEEHESREWLFDVAHLNLFVGGSTR